MVEQIKMVKIGDKEIKCMDLTYGYLISLNEGNPETRHGTVANGTDLTEDDVMKLRVGEVDVLYQAIMRLTYPNMYDEDGNEKKLPDEEEDKKKV